MSKKPYEGKDKLYQDAKECLTPEQYQFFDMHLYIHTHTDLPTLKEARDQCLALLDIKLEKEA